VLAEPALELAAPERAAWLEQAETVAPASFRDAAERAVEEARQGAPTLPMRFWVTKDASAGFDRAQQLLSIGQRRLKSQGETLDLLTNYWLAQNDPRLVPIPKRRRGRTGRGEKTRYIPRDVKATVERRSGGKCEVCLEQRPPAGGCPGLCLCRVWRGWCAALRAG